MAHWKRNKNEDSQEIKRAIGKGGLDDMPMPKSGSNETEESPKELPTVNREEIITKSISHPSDLSDRDAHVFVKVDRYDQIMDKMDKLKDSINHLNNIMTTYMDIDKMKGDVSDTLVLSLDELSERLTSLDGEFVRPEGREYELKEDPSLRKIREDIERLKNRVLSL